MSKTWSAYLLDSLVRLDNAKLRRQRRVFDSAGILDFGSNDYLGLRAHPQVLAALQSASRAAWGSGASPVLSGYTAEHAALERALADFAAAPDALLFSSGYACNVGTVACLAGQGDLLLSDQLNHASLIDGCRLSRAHTQVFPHGDVDFLRRLLRAQRTRYDKVLLLSESIFSMDGDAAPLIDLVALAEQYDCGL
ncbi:MAG: aminotransferase class I/II-fold pyridoxal phosphate-dependent enzyme, partial [Planctomycetales bacterium]|nr:aminotransferase class I/II-fold pyridoxal phosphate-dependent enzyme [Planctomycetales bacterium]